MILGPIYKNILKITVLIVHWVHQSKDGIATVLRVTNVVNTKLSSYIGYKFMCSCCNATFYDQTQTFFVRDSEQLDITPLTEKFD